MEEKGLTKATTIRWQLELYKSIEKAAKQKGLPVASYIRMIVKERIDEIEKRG